MAVADGHVIEWSPPENDRDRPGGRDLPDLAVHHRVAALQPGRHDVRVAGIDHVEDLERLDIELERVQRPRRVGRLADRAGTEASTWAMADGIVERGADDRHVGPAPGQLGRVRHVRESRVRGHPHVHRQIEVVEGLVPGIPAVETSDRAGGRMRHLAILQRWRRRFPHQGPAGRRPIVAMPGPHAPVRPCGPVVAPADAQRCTLRLTSTNTTITITNSAMGALNACCVRSAISRAMTSPTHAPRRPARIQSP